MERWRLGFWLHLQVVRGITFTTSPLQDSQFSRRNFPSSREESIKTLVHIQQLGLCGKSNLVLIKITKAKRLELHFFYSSLSPFDPDLIGFTFFLTQLFSWIFFLLFSPLSSFLSFLLSFFLLFLRFFVSSMPFITLVSVSGVVTFYIPFVVRHT